MERANMISKKDLAKLIEDLKKDKVLRTQTFLTTNKLSADSVVEKDGGTLLHLVCKMAAENVFWAVRRGARPSCYLAKDKHGRTPCHYAAINLIKTSKMSVFQNIIQPMIEDCVDCLHAPDKDGRTPLHVLSAHSVCADMVRAQLGTVPPTGRPPPDAWHEKIWEEMQYENSRFDKYDKDFSEYLSDDAEDIDSWSERIRGEHGARGRSSPAPPSPAEKRRQRREREEQARERRRAEEAERRRQHEQEQERARRFREAEEQRQKDEEARRRARDEARQRLGQTPKGASAKLSKVVRRYRSLHHLVHSEDGPLVTADFRVLGNITLQETRRLVEAGAENGTERRRAVRDMLRLWHPDKCMAKIVRRMTGDPEQVKSLVVSFVQLLNQLL
ncbi:NF-kappa-B inhibitor-like protein 1 isoform X1 [Amphibalanus amphitrite]|uniref:NF-kappa-B inhibitor-like protein 1 isoform X1 n=1 Tax=Amphibalanus amphitrite TaxID=1232801 RepID=UPI001C91B925|nr:NF-kappa-B inhibitor-like protein 1 isoform X1 [Amphibalanus amphitrite]